MDVRISAEDWKSTEMIRAENGLHDAIDRAGRAIADADRRLAEADEERSEGDNGIGALKAYAAGPDAPAVLRAAIEDVETGRRTREEALADPAVTADPVVMAALEVVTRPAAPSTEWPRRPRADDVGYDEEDFSTHRIMRPHD